MARNGSRTLPARRIVTALLAVALSALAAGPSRAEVIYDATDLADPEAGTFSPEGSASMVPNLVNASGESIGDGSLYYADADGIQTDLGAVLPFPAVAYSYHS